MDLIPRSYRQLIWKKQCLGYAMVSLAGFFMLTVAMYVWASSRISTLKDAISQMNQAETFVNQLKTEHQTLDDISKQLKYRVKLLGEFTKGPKANSMFTIIDSAIADKNIWFNDWRYQRTIEKNHQKNRHADHDLEQFSTEHLSQEAIEEQWAISTGMSIQGYTMDFETITSFMKQLSDNELIENVEVVHTNVDRTEEQDLINFKLNIKLNKNKHG